MTQEQSNKKRLIPIERSSLETDTEQIVRLIEENLKLRKQLADQKAKIRNKVIKCLNKYSQEYCDCPSMRIDILKEIEIV